ncbi:MAG TPA: hypothetical protein VHV56_00470 [Pseudolabrys sp.]|jgi:hypothetical protein|nr:hypothetical protein [Pseudolabrys sp.]
MRTLLVSLAAILCLCTINSAQAERRMFIISTEGALPGADKAAATAYCQSHQFAQAMSSRKVDRDDITGAIPSGGGGGCNGPKCEVIAIVCTR